MDYRERAGAFNKGLRIINSCVKVEHFDVATRYTELFLTKFCTEDINKVDLNCAHTREYYEVLLHKIRERKNLLSNIN